MKEFYLRVHDKSKIRHSYLELGTYSIWIRFAIFATVPTIRFVVRTGGLGGGEYEMIENESKSHKG